MQQNGEVETLVFKVIRPSPVVGGHGSAANPLRNVALGVAGAIVFAEVVAGILILHQYFRPVFADHYAPPRFGVYPCRGTDVELPDGVPRKGDVVVVAPDNFVNAIRQLDHFVVLGCYVEGRSPTEVCRFHRRCRYGKFNTGIAHLACVGGDAVARYPLRRCHRYVENQVGGIVLIVVKLNVDVAEELSRKPDVKLGACLPLQVLSVGYIGKAVFSIAAVVSAGVIGLCRIGTDIGVAHNAPAAFNLQVVDECHRREESLFRDAPSC
ncbi:hypothetical protein Barb6_02873 [Bacteroidales bacterium Barb6]|nr:hypothetical protein Barb6_02873 [Bacteroidales bacterium Barb6]